MGKLEAIVFHNTLGRLFGKHYIAVEPDVLTAYKNNLVVTSDSLCECREFATLTTGILGSTLTLKVSRQVKKHRFLKNEQSVIFLGILNTAIAAHLSEFLARLIRDFHQCVIHEYPRDCCLKNISSICESLHTLYHTQSQLWESHLSLECINSVREIIRFHPVQANALREHHEKIQLEKRASFF